MSIAATPAKHPIHGGWPILLLPVAAIALLPLLNSWMFMWVMVVSSFNASKWFLLLQYLRGGGQVTPWRAVCYLSIWPGMNAREFFDTDRWVARPALGHWLLAATNLTIGAALFWGVTRFVIPHSELVAGWVGMAGFIFLIHFGAFHLLALTFQSAGVQARPIMNAPIAATSLAEFWGRRWNLAFRDMAYGLVFRPATQRYGGATALWIAYLFSGLLHELVISLPAGAGFGLPTLYFLLQGWGMIVQRGAIGRRFHFAGGIPGRLFTAVLVVGAAPLLFNPPFIHRVILPMMQAVGAL